MALLPIVFSMFILILAQSAATSRAYAMKYDDSFNENVDLIGLGLANAAAGISGTFVVNGSPTKTEMVDNAGGRSQLAMLATGAVVVVVLLFLTVPLSYMPNAVLSAVVFLIGLKLVDYLGMRGIYGLRKDEFVVAAITAAVVVVRGRGAGDHPGDHPVAGPRPDARLQAARPRDGLRRRRRSRPCRPSSSPSRLPQGWSSTTSGPSCSTPTRPVSPKRSWTSSRAPIRHSSGWRSTLRPSATSTSPGADSVRQIQNELVGRNATLVLCAVDPAVRRLLDAYGLTDKIGAEHIFDRPIDVVTAYSKLATSGRLTTVT